jgi:hypothetical protein
MVRFVPGEKNLVDTPALVLQIRNVPLFRGLPDADLKAISGNRATLVVNVPDKLAEHADLEPEFFKG